MKNALVVAVLLAAGPARALDPWTTQDTIAEALLVGLIAADAGQTHMALLEGGHEMNPILGPHPSAKRLNSLAASAALSHALIARVLPRRWRTGWQHLAIVAEASAVGLNAKAMGGVRLAFAF